MGVLPLEFVPGETAQSLGLSGHESFTIEGVSKLTPRMKLRVNARDDQGKEKVFETVARADTPEEVAYYRNGGILPYVLRQML
jgi:aconitate hydratase